jgi:hypothetical protein
MIHATMIGHEHRNSPIGIEATLQNASADHKFVTAVKMRIPGSL